jgi:hypothetical protein
VENREAACFQPVFNEAHLQLCLSQSRASTGCDCRREKLTVGGMSAEEYPVQRRTPRYPFVAPAAVLPETGVPIGGNVKELSLYGCYLDTASPLAPRSKVLVKIFMPGEYFEANATVAYATPALGMGLVFRDVKSHFRTVLRKWLLMAMQLSQPTTLQGAEAREFIHGTADGEQEESAGGGKKDRTGES